MRINRTLELKSRPKAAFQFKPDDRGLGRQQSWLGLPTIRHEADACEAEKHHLRRTPVSEM
jgi:hypothetical protein